MFNPWLVAASFSVMVVGTLTTAQLAYNIAHARRSERGGWLCAAALALGCSAWAMNLLNLHAWHGTLEPWFRPWTLAAALLPAVGGSAVALLVVTSPRPRLQRITLATLILSLSLVVTQQLGFRALTFSRAPEFDPVILVVAALLAAAACALALTVLSLRFEQAPLATGLWQRASAALLVGTGLCGMDLSGLLALEPVAGTRVLRPPGSTDGVLLTALTVGNTLLMLVFLMLLSWIDRRRLLSTLALSQRKMRSVRRIADEIDAQAKELTRALQKSQQRLALAMEGSQDGLWDVDVAANEVLISRRMAMMLGLGSQNLSLDSSAVLDMLDQAQRVRLLRSVLVHWRSRLQRPLDCNLQVFSDAGGRRRSLHVRGSSVLDESGQPLRLAGSLTDVTLQRQHERELRAYAALLEQHPDPLMVMDLGGRVDVVNLAALRLLGCPRASVLGHSIRGLLRRFRPRGLLGRVRAALLATGHWRGEVEVRGALGWQRIRLNIDRIVAVEHERPQWLMSAQLPERSEHGMPSAMVSQGAWTRY